MFHGKLYQLFSKPCFWLHFITERDKKKNPIQRFVPPPPRYPPPPPPPPHTHTHTHTHANMHTQQSTPTHPDSDEVCFNVKVSHTAYRSKPVFINITEMTSTTVALQWPNASGQDTGNLLYKVFYSQHEDKNKTLSPTEPKVFPDHDMYVGVRVVGLRPDTMNYVEVQSGTDDPDLGLLFNKRTVIAVTTRGELTNQVFSIKYVSVLWTVVQSLILIKLW